MLHIILGRKCTILSVSQALTVLMGTRSIFLYVFSFRTCLYLNIGWKSIRSCYIHQLQKSTLSMLFVRLYVNTCPFRSRTCEATEFNIASKTSKYIFSAYLAAIPHHVRGFLGKELWEKLAMTLSSTQLLHRGSHSSTVQLDTTTYFGIAFDCDSKFIIAMLSITP